MSKQLEYDPETGKMVEVTSAKATKLKIPAHLRYSRFVDDEAEGVFNIAVPVGGDTFFARELDEELLDSVTERMAEQEALQARLKGVFERSDAVAINKGQQEMLAALKEQRAMYREILEKTLVGWTLERPFAAEAIKSLSVSTRAAVARGVLRASQVGADEADFLASAS